MDTIKTVLVTGGAGFIGTHTCIELLKKGYSVIILDSFINSSQKSIECIKKIFKISNPNVPLSLEFHRGSLVNKNFVLNLFSNALAKGLKIDAVIHFAGVKSVKESILNPLLYWEENVLGTINLLGAMDRFSCNKIVFSSSATIYKATNSKFINEGCEKAAINPYGNTKIVNENLLLDIFKSNKDKWQIMNLRYFNPIGAHPSGLIGEFPKGLPDNIFPLIMQSALNKNCCLKVFGNDWPTKDGTCIRDYVHVMDISDGHINALEFLCKNNANIYSINLGTGKGTSVLELIKIFEITNNVKINFSFEKRRDGDLAELVADNSLANNLLGWKPLRNIEEMCRDGWRWKLKNPMGYI